MRRKNELLHADIARVVELKRQIGTTREIAERHHTTPQTVRTLISRKLREIKINTCVQEVPCGTKKLEETSIDPHL
jgi:predicted transcriptional regulator